MSELKTSGTTIYQNGPINGTTTTTDIGSKIVTSGTTIYQNGPINGTTTTTDIGSKIVTSDFDFSPNGPINGPGTGVQIKYDAVIDICDKMIALANELNDQWDAIKNIINARDEYWRGEAADRFFDDINVDYNAAKEITSSEQMLKYIQKVKELVENNKKTDTVITENDITKINEMLPTFSFLTIGTVSDGIDQTKLDAAHTNSNVGSENVGTVSDGIDNDLLNNAHTNSNVGSENVGTVSDGLDSESLNKVGANDNINSQSVDKVSDGLENESLESVKTSDTETDALKYTGNSEIDSTAEAFASSSASINLEENK